MSKNIHKPSSFWKSTCLPCDNCIDRQTRNIRHTNVAYHHILTFLSHVCTTTTYTQTELDRVSSRSVLVKRTEPAFLYSTKKYLTKQTAQCSHCQEPETCTLMVTNIGANSLVWFFFQFSKCISNPKASCFCLCCALSVWITIMVYVPKRHLKM